MAPPGSPPDGRCDILGPVRRPLLEEAQQSPTLLSDLAGLERYIAESYDARSFIELLQNADDAGARRLSVTRANEYLIVANDGRPFTRRDFESLCRSAASEKTRGVSIGYRGIGFKSVVAFADEIHLFSASLAATFSRDLTRKALCVQTDVPLIRVPHPVPEPIHRGLAAFVKNLFDEGFTTLFVFSCSIRDAIQNEFEDFDPSALLFLRNINRVETTSNVGGLVSVERRVVQPSTTAVRISTKDYSREWRLIERDGVTLAVVCGDSGPSRLEEPEAVVHAFLPTLEKTGLAVKLNGDVSTDPSRTRVVLDERTAAVTRSMAALYIGVLEESLAHLPDQDDLAMIFALVPTTDPRLIGLQRRSFCTQFFGAVQELVGNRFGSYRWRPSWINGTDFVSLASVIGLRVVPPTIEQQDGALSFLRFLGLREAVFEELLPAVGKASLGVQGSAEIVASLATRFATKQFAAVRLNVEWPIWWSSGGARTLTQIAAEREPLDRGYLDQFVEARGSLQELRRLLSELVGREAATLLLSSSSETEQVSIGESLPRGLSAPSVVAENGKMGRISLTRWRSAEQHVLEILRAHGWLAWDVSRQNVGYDIEARRPDGTRACVEVKLIERAGQPFALTTNEEGVARQEGDNYVLALLVQAANHLDLALVSNPVSRLPFVRQCRQWVWECSEYEFNPERYPFG